MDRNDHFAAVEFFPGRFFKASKIVMMNAKIFSYKVDAVKLEPLDEHLKMSESFDRKAILEPLKELFHAQNYKIDEASISYKIIEDQLYLQGMAVEKQEPKEAGFRFGRPN
jgi:hypothetical protein